MKYFLAATLISISWNVFASDLHYDIIEKHKNAARKKAVLLKILALADAQDAVQNAHIKEYIGHSLFGDQWRHFRYPAEKFLLLSADEAIARNVIVAMLEKNALAEGRFDVYSFMIQHTDKTRFL